MTNVQKTTLAKPAAVAPGINRLRKTVSLAAASSIALVALGGAAAPMAQAAPAAAVGAAASTDLRGPCAYVGKHPPLRPGSQGRAVRHLQCMLQDLGYRYVAVDGSFGPKTRQAVLAFQRAQRIQVDGSVGPQTWAALHRAMNKKQRSNSSTPYVAV